MTGEIRYMALGDSVSEGAGTTPSPEAGSYPSLLANKWRARGCTVQLSNVAISGYTAQDIINDEVPQIDGFKPTFITFQTGANDIVKNVTIDTYRTNVKKILDAAKASGARVVVMPQNEWFRSPQGKEYGPNLAEKRAAYDQVMIEETQARGAEFIDLRVMFKDHADRNLWGPDGIHPTQEAYSAWATELARIIPSPCGK